MEEHDRETSQHLKTLPVFLSIVEVIHCSLCDMSCGVCIRVYIHLQCLYTTYSRHAKTYRL